MKKIKNKRHFAVGLVAAVVAVACLVAGVSTEQSMRYYVAFFLALVYAVVNFYSSFTKRGLLEEIQANADERDKYLIMKTSQMSIKLLNYLLLAAVLVSLILYTAFRSSICLMVAITLCAELVVLFVLVLCVNNYYENHG